MNLLELTLWIKIVFTFVFWATPLLLAPGSLFARFGFPIPTPIVYVRILGGAFFALMTGYCYGLWELTHLKIRPTQTILVGIVSNGSASLVLMWFGINGYGPTWGRFAKIVMWGSTAATGLIAIALFLLRNSAID